MNSRGGNPSMKQSSICGMSGHAICGISQTHLIGSQVFDQFLLDHFPNLMPYRCLKIRF